MIEVKKLLNAIYLLFLCVLSFSAQGSYQYDAAFNLVSSQNAELNSEKFSYDNTRNLRYCCNGSVNKSLQEKAQDGSFFVFELGLVAAKGTNLASNSRARHMLFGDATGGGHKFGFSGLFNGKSKFPATWNQDRILHAVSDIATDPNLNWVQQTGRTGSFFTRSGNPARFTVEGVRDGTRIKVVVEPAGEGIITAFPIK